jgi:hypothetical protein
MNAGLGLGSCEMKIFVSVSVDIINKKTAEEYNVKLIN